jgi:hypothetical protein
VRKVQKSSAVKFFIVVFIAGAGIVFALTERERKPLGQALPVDFSSAMSQSARQQFLDGDFTIISDVRVLPSHVLEAFTEQNGSRMVIANPGKDFIVGDVIYDSTVPQKRLIFAGVSGERCFVHYEQGGRAHMYVLALFSLTSPTGVKPRWQGYCRGPAANISDLRSQLISGECR